MSDSDDREARFQLNEVADFIRRSRVSDDRPFPAQTVELEKGTVIFREGQRGDAMYIVQEGLVEIIKLLEDGTSRILRTMGKGDFFGEMALIDRKVRSASASCRTAVKLVRVPQESLLGFIETNPLFVMRILNTFVDRLRSSNTIIEKAMVRHPTLVVLDGLRDFVRYQTDPRGSGAFDPRDFAAWASYRLGIPDSKVPGILAILQAEGHLLEGPQPGTLVLVPGQGL